MARQVRRVENYTNAALVMGLVNLLWILTLIWAIWGLAAVLLISIALNHAITLLERRTQVHED
ncbi:histidinol phosphate aminotransferase [uncultured Shimia sp.]|uniref:histidinol phosphate aminotransferase n=1 Tax=uncultured Shimia sp. TaxID=573152 RepID=UPI00260595B7|nr:histidinol phosphate aminotransferase [uncultured Shimia sp.]